MAPQQLSSAVCEVAQGEGMASFQRQLELNWWAGEGCTACLTQVKALNCWAKAPMFVSEAAVGWVWLCQEPTAVVKVCSCSSHPGQHSCSFPMPSNIKWTLGATGSKGWSHRKVPHKNELYLFSFGFLWHEQSTSTKEGWDSTDGNGEAGSQPGMKMGCWTLSYWQQQAKHLSQFVVGQHPKLHL